MKQLKITKFPALDYAGNEAFNTLSTNLSFAGASVKKIMITSCHAAEGKSYLSMNLMRTLAQRGIKVALVDADLRRSLVNSDYGLKYEDGRNAVRASPIFWPVWWAWMRSSTRPTSPTRSWCRWAAMCPTRWRC